MNGFQPVVIRPLQSADVDAAADLLVTASASGDRSLLADRLRSTEPGELDHAFVAVRGSIVVGAAKLTTAPVFPGTAAAMVVVRELQRGQRIGDLLAEALANAAAKATGLEKITCTLPDDQAEGRKFAERHGFELTNHSVGWQGDVAGRGPQLADAAAACAIAADVRIRRADVDTELAVVIDCVRRCLAGLPLPFGEGQDVDVSQVRTVIPEEAVLLLAESEGRAIGLTVGSPMAARPFWYTNFTGVDSAERRRGVATALKSALLVAAHDAGAEAVVTHNDDTNDPILRLNESFGMARGVGYWGMARRLASGV